MTEHSYAQDVRDGLHAIAEVAASIPMIGEGQHVEAAVALDRTATLELAVHSLEPDALDAALAEWPAARGSIDADSLLRWVTVELDGVEVTFYRR